MFLFDYTIQLLNYTLCCLKLSLNYILFFSFSLVLILLSIEKSTNSNTIPAFGIVFQYNTIGIAHIWFKVSPMFAWQPFCNASGKHTHSAQIMTLSDKNSQLFSLPLNPIISLAIHYSITQTIYQH